MENCEVMSDVNLRMSLGQDRAGIGRMLGSPKRLVGVICLLTLPATLGCSLCAPKGPMNMQQSRAVVHDPFPQLDIGPYDAAIRPPGYEQPLPESERNRLIADAVPQLGR